LCAQLADFFFLFFAKFPMTFIFDRDFGSAFPFDVQEIYRDVPPAEIDDLAFDDLRNHGFEFHISRESGHFCEAHQQRAGNANFEFAPERWPYRW